MSTSRNDTDNNSLLEFLARNATTQSVQLALYALHEESIRRGIIGNLTLPLVMHEWGNFNFQGMRGAPFTGFSPKDLFFRMHAIGEVELASLRALATPIGRSALPDIINMWGSTTIPQLALSGKYGEAMHAFEEMYKSRAFLDSKHLNRLEYTYKGAGALSAAFVAYQVAQSQSPAYEALHQGTLVGGGLIGGFEAGLLALGPCAAAGPYAPACVALATFAGSMAGTEAAEALWNVSRSISAKLPHMTFSCPSFIGRANAVDDFVYTGTVPLYQHKRSSPSSKLDGYPLSIAKGVANGLGATFEVIRHPWDNFLGPVSSYLRDVQTQTASKFSDGAFRCHPFSGDLAMLQAVNDLHPHLAIDANKRMAERTECIDSLWGLMRYGTGPQRAQFTAQMITGYIAGGFVVSSLRNIPGLARNIAASVSNFTRAAPQAAPTMQKTFIDAVRQVFPNDVITVLSTKNPNNLVLKSPDFTVMIRSIQLTLDYLPRMMFDDCQYVNVVNVLQRQGILAGIPQKAFIRTNTAEVTSQVVRYTQPAVAANAPQSIIEKVLFTAGGTASAAHAISKQINTTQAVDAAATTFSQYMAYHAEAAPQAQALVTSSTAKMMMAISTAAPPRNNTALVNRCAANIQALQSSQREFCASIAARTSSVDLTSFSAAERPSITYSGMAERQWALANSSFLFSSLNEYQPPVSRPGGFSSGGEGGFRMECDSTGRCYFVSGGGSNKDCRDTGSSQCKSSITR